MNEAVMTAILEELCVQYGKMFNATAVKFWLIVWQGVSEQDFMSALHAYLRSDRAGFFPQPGEVYQHYIKAQQVNLPSVSDALLEVRQTLNRYEGQPKYSHPLITRAVAAIGYYRLCDMSSDDISREFRVTYGELRKHHLDKPVNEHPMVEGRRSGMGSLGDALGSMSGLLGGRSQ